MHSKINHSRKLRLKCDGTRAETRFRLSAKWTSPFKSAGASVRSTAGSRGVRISGSNAEYTTFRASVKGTGYPLHSPVSPSLPLPCATVCHHISTGLLPIMNSFTWKLKVNSNKFMYISTFRTVDNVNKGLPSIFWDQLLLFGGSYSCLLFIRFRIRSLHHTILI
jgi:hypothetical protein